MKDNNFILETIFLKIANFRIGINFHKIEPPFLVEKSFSDRIHYYAYGFIENGNFQKADYWIDFFNQEYFETYIKTNKKKLFVSIFEKPKKQHITSYYHISEEHFRLILRTICQELLVSNQGMLMHASASLINNKAIIFLGDSGAGKSTIVNLLSQTSKPLADDIIIIKKEKDQDFFYQTPFREKNLWINKSFNKYSIGGIFFLKKSLYNKIEKISSTEYLQKNILKQLLTNSPDYQKQFPNLNNFLNKFNKFYILHFSLNNQRDLIKILSDETGKL